VTLVRFRRRIAQTRAAGDAGFTLVELVMAIIVLFIALTASVQIIVSMVAATVANRHIDLAMSVASQTMETAVAFDCGGQMLDPKWNPAVPDTVQTTAFYTALQARCTVPLGQAVAAGDVNRCFAAVATNGHDATIDEDFRHGYLPTFDQDQTDLASRRFAIYKNAASFSHTTATGSLPVCTTIKMVWKYVKPFGVASVADDGSSSSLRLQRVVHVEWQEPHSTRVRWRELSQVAALPPDSKMAVNTGRIMAKVGVGGSATMLVPVTGQRLTYGADDAGFVNFPFLPPATYTIEVAGTPVSVTVNGDAKCIPQGTATALAWTLTCA
jgi:type II secretory pathway pseudopilin PulG